MYMKMFYRYRSSDRIDAELHLQNESSFLDVFGRSMKSTYRACVSNLPLRCIT